MHELESSWFLFFLSSGCVSSSLSASVSFCNVKSLIQTETSPLFFHPSFRYYPIELEEAGELGDDFEIALKYGYAFNTKTLALPKTNPPI